MSIFSTLETNCMYNVQLPLGRGQGKGSQGLLLQAIAFAKCARGLGTVISHI
jgi:hypothetical protein